MTTDGKFDHGTSGGYERSGCRCDLCRAWKHAVNQNEYYNGKGKARSAAASLAKYYEKRAFLDSVKAKPCMDCGGTFPPECMDLDHRPETVKLFSIGWSLGMHGMASIRAEIEKCDVVCSNCHRMRTKTRRNGSKIAVPQATGERRAT